MKKLFFIYILLLPICAYASFFDDFSNSSLSEEWDGDRSLFKITQNKLKLDAPADSAGAATLSCVSAVSGTAEWTIRGKMSFKPSGNNLCQIYLMSDAPAIGRVSNGIFLQLGGTQKDISLRKVLDGRKTIVGKSAENRIAQDTVAFEVVVRMTEENKFEVFSKINNEEDLTKDFSTSESFWFDSQFFHLNCIYTKTRSKSFSFDYVGIEGENNALPPLKLKSSEMGENSLNLVFNRSIDSGNVSVLVNGVSETDYAVEYNKLVIFSDFIAEKESATINYSVCDYSGNCIVNHVKLESYPLPQNGDVQINEIMYDPKTGGAEFLEIYNNTDKTFSLADIMLAKPSNSVSSKYTFYVCGESGELLNPHGYALLTKDTLSVCAMNACGEGTKVSLSRFPAINNEGGNLFLFNRDTILVDSVYYSKKMHTMLSSDTKGTSLERSCESGQFFSSSGATPCALNSICGTAEVSEEKDEYVRMTNSVITFGSDNVEIEYALPFENAYLLAVVYDKDGREIRKLASEEKVDSIGEILWDGTDASGNLLSASPYVIFLHFYTTERKGGIKKRFLCTIGAR